MFFKLWIKKFRDIKVRDHLHTFVVVIKEEEKSYSFNSSLISFQNQTEIVINNVEIFVMTSAYLYSPIKSKRLMKNKVDIFQ